MKWSDNIMEAFSQWLRIDTFHTGHALDEKRFFNFVVEVWRENQCIWDEMEVGERIVVFIKDNHNKFDDAFINKVADDKVSDGTTILDFLSHLKSEGKLGLLQ